ncbi:MAG: carbohydrate ABC transporter permease [Actinobacteria bacterium]|nr:carbohydrate ABC transporter permease [Actinomycetota bacterium]
MGNKLYGNNKVFTVFNIIILFLIAFAMLYPFIYVISTSVSSPDAITKGEVILFPRGFHITSYKVAIASNDILNAYKNTLIYTVLGTIFTLIISSLAAYPLTRKKLPGRKSISLLIAITMFIPVGIIGNFLVVKELGLIDTVWALTLPPAFMGFNIFLMRSGFKNIPDSLIESAYIDGASEWRILRQIILPLSKETFLVVGLFAAIFQWNSFMAPLLYLNDPNMFPLTIMLRRILLQGGTSAEYARLSSQVGNTTYGGVDILTGGFVVSLKMAAIILSIAPILLLYPFIQKYFTKGAMLGSIKE